MKNEIAAVVLAAGEGKRLKSPLPKTLHPVAGRPLVVHVVAALSQLAPDRLVVVGPKNSEPFRSALDVTGFESVELVVQDPPLGTGDAVRRALGALGDWNGTIVVANGDTPLVTPVTFAALLEIYERSAAAAAMLTARVADPSGLGRIVRDGDRVVAIVEETDADASTLQIDEINAGVFVFESVRLKEMLDKVDSTNAQGEYYLTDVVGLLVSAGDTVVAHMAEAEEVSGINTRAQLNRVDEAARLKISERWMDAGVTIVDPATTFIDASVEIASGATIRPFTFLEGATKIGAGADVGPQTRVVDSEIGEGATVTFAVVRGSVIGPEASVGPYASLRPGTKLERGAKIGTFVETKETTLGEGSKANHLSYLGDAEIGKGVNVGAGSITCNWDGQEKHKTVIEDDAYISSDTMLVAPTRIGKRAATGAGSVVKGDVPDDALAVGVPARIIEGKGDKLGRKKGSSEGKPSEGPEEPRQ